MAAVIGDPRKAGESGPAGDQRAAGEAGEAGDPRPAGEASAKRTEPAKQRHDDSESRQGGGKRRKES